MQLWRCGSCKRVFTPGPAALRNKTYPIRLVLQALTLYDLGYSLDETAKRLKSKSGRAISPATIAMWIGAHKDQTTFRRLRAEATTIYPPSKPSAQSSFITGRSTPTRIIARSLPSCAAIRSIGASRHLRHSSRTFHQLARMNSSAARTIPRPALRRRARLSPIPTASSSTAKRTRPRQLPASSFPPWVPTSCDTRHCKISCSRTTRVRSRSEIPIWLTEDEISALETRYGIELAAGGAPRSITGHIDFLQVRNDAVHVLDYKPDARTNKPIAQLAIYALALTIRVPGLKLFDIKCAWFNEDEYNEFFPRTLFAKHSD